jgi:hypothetical protein
MCCLIVNYCHPKIGWVSDPTKNEGVREWYNSELVNSTSVVEGTWARCILYYSQSKPCYFSFGAHTYYHTQNICIHVTVQHRPIDTL